MLATPACGPIAVMSAVITVRQSRMNMTSRRPISRRINAANAWSGCKFRNNVGNFGGFLSINKLSQ